MSTIRDLIISGNARLWKRAYMKRVLPGGSYEDEWYEITPWVSKWGTIRQAYGDEVFLGDYQIEGFDIELVNNTRLFSDEKDSNSLFYRYATRYRTKFKISCGYYYDDDGDLVPIEGRSFYGIMYSNPITSTSGVVKFSVAPMIKVFENHKALGIDTSTGTTEELITRLVTQEINGARVFDRYFEGNTDAEKYKINPRMKSVTTISSPIINEDATVWDKIKDYAIIDDFFSYVDNDGAFVFDSKDVNDVRIEYDLLFDGGGSLLYDDSGNALFTETETTETYVWKFNGAGSFDNEYGITITTNDELEVEEDIQNLWTRVVIEYNSGKAISEQSWTPGDNSVVDIYGERIFSKSLDELTLSEAQGVADKLRSSFGSVKERTRFSTVFIPQLELKDQVEINYAGFLIPPSDVFTVGVSLLGGPDVLGKKIGSVVLQKETAKIVGFEIDLDAFETKFEVREV